MEKAPGLECELCRLSSPEPNITHYTYSWHFYCCIELRVSLLSTLSLIKYAKDKYSKLC
jgi:hypothetical protein